MQVNEQPVPRRRVNAMIHDSITTKRLDVVNHEGSVIASISSSADGRPRFELFDHEDGCARVVIEVLHDRVSIGILNRDGITVAGVGADTQQGGGLMLMSEKRSTMLTILAGSSLEDSLAVLPINE